MRTDIELLTILLNNIVLRLDTGLCQLGSKLWNLEIITIDELRRINYLISMNKPEHISDYLEFTGYYFEIGDKKARIEYLTNLINKLNQ